MARRMLLVQFKDLRLIILIGAAIFAQVLGEAQNTIARVAIIILSAILVISQEYWAERAMEALHSIQVG